MADSRQWHIALNKLNISGDDALCYFPPTLFEILARSFVVPYLDPLDCSTSELRNNNELPGDDGFLQIIQEIECGNVVAVENLQLCDGGNAHHHHAIHRGLLTAGRPVVCSNGFLGKELEVLCVFEKLPCFGLRLQKSIVLL